MADSNATTTAQAKDTTELKHLEFFRLYTIRVVAFLSTLYGHLKDLSGSLKPTLESFEGTLLHWLKPVYALGEEKASQLLVFADKKVDQTLALTEQYFNFVKSTIYYFLGLLVKAQELTKQGLVLSKEFASDVLTIGPIETTKAYAAKYQPVVLDTIDTAWKVSLKLPLVPQAVEVAAPAVFFAGGFYNQLMKRAKDAPVPLVKPLLELMPILPVDKLEEKVRKDVKVAVGAPTS